MKISKNKYIAVFVIAITLMMSFTSFHKYYISMTEMKIDADKKSFNISCSMFIDDLESTIEKSKGIKVDLIKETEKKETKDLLSNYMNQHFKLIGDKKDMPYNFIGYEVIDNSVWCYLEVEKFRVPKKLIIINSLLYDYLPEQSNIIQLQTKTNSYTRKLSYPEIRSEIELK